MSATPTSRTMEYLREDMHLVCKSEYWQPSFLHRQLTDTAISFATNKCGKDKLVDAFTAMRKGGSGKRKDLFGFADIVAINRQHQKIVAVQCTTRGMMQKRRHKMESEVTDEFYAWMSAGGWVYLIGWREYKETIGRRRWRPTVWLMNQMDTEFETHELIEGGKEYATINDAIRQKKLFQPY